MEAMLQKDGILNEGEIALLLVLGTMVELGRAKTLTPKQLDNAMSPVIDMLRLDKRQKPMLDRIRTYQRTWSPGTPTTRD
jgi:hypothetical protein